MKKTIFLVSLLAIIASRAKAQTWIPFDSLKEKKIISTEIIQSDAAAYKVRVLIHGLSDKLVNNETGEFHHISIGGNNYLANIGEPSLPIFSQLIAIPAGGRISAEIIDEQWTNVEIGRIYPTQKPLYGTEKPDGFDFAEEVYQNSYLPPLLDIGQTMQWRNIKNANVFVCPFKYYPQENRLSVMNQFILNVIFEYDGEQIPHPYTKADDPWGLFDNISYDEASATTSVSTASFNGGNVLYQNTPNPFKEQTTIRFSLANDARDASICIFDMTGKKLKNLPISSGKTSVSLNGWELGEGIFLYTLIVNGKEIDAKRMIIRK